MNQIPSFNTADSITALIDQPSLADLMAAIAGADDL
jgi:hypothetical protein